MIRGLATIAACLALAAPAPGFAQGVAGSAVSGRITEAGAAGDPVAGAQVQLRNPRTGDTFTTRSGSNGEYAFDNVPAGGPYLLTAQAEGYQVTSQGGLGLGLGQRLHLKLELEPQAGAIEEIAIFEEVDRLYDRGRAGPSRTVNDPLLRGLPLQGRNFTDLLLTTPQAYAQAGGSSIAGQNPRLNNIQIDGGSSNDLFGASQVATPGGLANARAISIEALRELVVEVAPFDVRHGRFTGGLVNAVTRSGENQHHGGAFVYFQNKALAGRRDDPGFLDYSTWQLGAFLGGPILLDELHFFVAADLQDRHSLSGDLLRGIDDAADLAAVGFDNATARRFQDLLATRYGIRDAGDALAAQVTNPDRNVFAKLTTSLVANSHLELSYNLVDASLDVVTRLSTAPRVPGRLRDGYQLSGSGLVLPSTNHALRGKLTSSWGTIANELLLGVSIQRDARRAALRRPLILVKAGRLGASDAWLAAGGDRFSQANGVDQQTFQVQDNLTFALGRHRLTAGTSNDLLFIRNEFLQAAHGVWVFDSLDDLEAGTASVYQRRFDLGGGSPPGTIAFSAVQLGFYLQDEWSVTSDLTLSPGVRLDVPLLSQADTNPMLAGLAGLDIDTGRLPSGNLLWSPRLGVNWDVLGDASTILRGGAGVFSGRPVYLWVGNAYRQNGLSQVELTCTAATGVPPFSVDPDDQPASCAGGPTPTLPANAGEIDYFDPDTRHPQNLRLAAGLDRRLPWGLIGTLDGTYTREINGWTLSDRNLVPQGVSGEGRQLYGTFATTGFRATPERIDAEHLAQAIEVRNTAGGEVFTATAQLQKSFRGKRVRLDASAAYTFSRQEDRLSMTGFQLVDQFQLAPLDGTIQDRNVRPGAFDRPHKITVSAVAALPHGLALGLAYVGQSGTPYTWTVNGDVNADGISGNDLVYVPAGAGDITLQGDPNDPEQAARLERFIDGQDCLREARGRLIERGACRNPWHNLVNLRIGWTSPPLHGDAHRFELQLDVFNLMNLLDADWGLFRQATAGESHGAAFLRAVGYDAERNRPIYGFAAPPGVVTTTFSPTLSRWRIQLGARYTF